MDLRWVFELVRGPRRFRLTRHMLLWLFISPLGFQELTGDPYWFPVI